MMDQTAASANAERLPSRLRTLAHLIRGVWLQTMRRNELWVVTILMGLYLLGALVMRIVGIESPEVARFITGLGLGLAWSLAGLLAIVTGARQITSEIEQRTIYPVLAKPISRFDFLLGKALSTWLLGTTAMLLFTGLTLLLTPHLPYQQLGLLGQALALNLGALAVVTAMTVALAMWTPAGVAMLVAGAIFLGGTMLGGMLAQMAGPAAGEWLRGLIPDLNLLNAYQRYVEGGDVLGAWPFVGRLVYVFAWTAIFGGLATHRFRRMML